VRQLFHDKQLICYQDLQFLFEIFFFSDVYLTKASGKVMCLLRVVILAILTFRFCHQSSVQREEGKQN
jgi:hypothetical protein